MLCRFRSTISMQFAQCSRQCTSIPLKEWCSQDHLCWGQERLLKLSSVTLTAIYSQYHLFLSANAVNRDAAKYSPCKNRQDSRTEQSRAEQSNFLEAKEPSDRVIRCSQNIVPYVLVVLLHVGESPCELCLLVLRAAADAHAQ
jgi:hypothetical protein